MRDALGVRHYPELAKILAHVDDMRVKELFESFEAVKINPIKPNQNNTNPILGEVYNKLYHR
jgi:hypothetical protein